MADGDERDQGGDDIGASPSRFKARLHGSIHFLSCYGSSSDLYLPSLLCMRKDFEAFGRNIGMA